MIIIVFCLPHPRNGMNFSNLNLNLIWMRMKKTSLTLKIESMQKNSWRRWMIGKWMDVQMLMLKIPSTARMMTLLRDLLMQKTRLKYDRRNYFCCNCR